MKRLARLLTTVVCAVALAGCITLPSSFDYAQDPNASAEVLMPYPLRVKSVNGRAVSLPPVLEFPYTVSVDAGESVLAFQYGETWGTGDDNVLKRGPIMAVAFQAQAGERYEVDFERPTDVRKLAQADDYVASFTAWLSDAGGARTDAVSTGETGGLLANLLGSQQAEAPAASSAQATKASVAAASAAATTIPTTPSASPSSADQGERLESAKQLWQQMDADERQAFMQWALSGN